MDLGAEQTHSLRVGEGGGGRLDRFVSTELDLSRTRVQRLLSAGRITVDGRPAKKSESVVPGMRIEVVVPAPEPLEIEPQDLPIDIVHQDPDFVVVNKAAGMVVHPAPGHRSGTLVNALLCHITDLSGTGGRPRHRIRADPPRSKESLRSLPSESRSIGSSRRGSPGGLR